MAIIALRGDILRPGCAHLRIRSVIHALPAVFDTVYGVAEDVPCCGIVVRHRSLHPLGNSVRVDRMQTG